jgi:phosphoribosyl-dephospho-CoA transferase
MTHAHDIVKLDKEVLDSIHVPEWYTLEEDVFATVRRGVPRNPSYLPVGLRGTERAQRFAFEAPCNMIKRTIHPWMLTNKESFRTATINTYPVYQQYLRARTLLRSVRWGVGGSLGFELATGQAAVKPTSDLDLLLYADTAAKLPYDLFTQESDFFQNLDIQVITPQGGFALKEFLAQPNKKILLKTDEGPKLTTEIW